MRNAFASQITALAQENQDIVLLSGDIGNRLFDDFKAKCPNRFYNCGVAEANMIGTAAGLGMSGLRPVCYTIAPFITYRCLEQIRIDLCYHHVPVIVVGTGAGLSYASLGGTHHSCEEVGMLRLLPGLTVLAPADSLEVRSLLKAAFREPGPIYMRIGKKGEPPVHKSEPALVIGKAISLRKGSDVCILSMGTMLLTAIQTAELLEKHGISAEVVHFHTVKPLDETVLAELSDRFKLIATIEEHSILGGLGGSVAEWYCRRGEIVPRLIPFGTKDEFLHQTCDQDEAREFFGLTPEKVSLRIIQALSGRSIPLITK